ncbi:MAG: hypothetical protein FJ148_20870 [Deltaproteobacteria bacterium]|nr:hypothetical protein [Deltaproteobacteria bacterium]
MKTTTIRELKHETGKVLGWVARGETVEVHRRRKPVARLCPPDQPVAIERPDFAARLRAVYRTKTLRRTGTAVVSDARGES